MSIVSQFYKGTKPGPLSMDKFVLAEVNQFAYYNEFAKLS